MTTGNYNTGGYGNYGNNQFLGDFNYKSPIVTTT